MFSIPDQVKVEIIVNWLQIAGKIKAASTYIQHAEQRWLLVFDNVVEWESVSP